MFDLFFVLCCVFFGVLHLIFIFLYLKYDNPIPELVLFFVSCIVVLLYVGGFCYAGFSI